jgi:hypothetical protein
MKNIYFRFIDWMYWRKGVISPKTLEEKKASCLRDAFYALLKFNIPIFKLEMRTYKRFSNK